MNHELLDEAQRVKIIAETWHRPGVLLEATFKNRSRELKAQFLNPKDIPTTIQSGYETLYLWHIQSLEEEAT